MSLELFLNDRELVMGKSIHYDSTGIKIGETFHSYSIIRRIVLSDAPMDKVNIYLFDANSRINYIAISGTENIDFLKGLVSQARSHGVEIESLPSNMIMCPKCGTFVSPNAPTCVRCGHAFPKNQPNNGVGFFGVIVAVIVAVLIIAFVG